MTAPVFGAQINWREPHQTELGYLTAIMAAEDGTEQRVQLRVVATRAESFTVSAYDARAVAQLGPDVFRAPGARVTVPCWPDASTLTAPASSGATALVCDATDRGFTVGGYAVLWRSPTAHERVTIGGVSGGGLTVGALASDWPAGALVLPGRIGRLTNDLERSRENPVMTDLPITVEYEMVLTYGVADESGGV